MTLDEKVRVFKALADGNRLRIIKMLQVRHLCVCEITEILGLATSTVSGHLAILRDAGFIAEFKDGKWVNYKIQTPTQDPELGALGALLHVALNDVTEIQRDRTRVMTVDRIALCQ